MMLVEKEEHGLDCVVLQSPDQRSSCKVLLWGATVVSWVEGGVERLFVSSVAKYDEKKAIRGGIPVVFPQFGRPDEKMAQHVSQSVLTAGKEQRVCNLQ